MADEGINVAILKGLIEIGYDPEKMATFIDQLTSAKAKQIAAKTEGDRLKQSFDKLSASLDPVVARQLKYNQAVTTLDRALKAGIITQQQYNITLAQAKERLQDTTTWSQRLGAEIGGNLKSQFLSFVNPTTLAVGAVTGGLAALVAGTRQVIQVSIEAEESQRKVAFAVDQYGERAGVTVGLIDDLANAQSRLTGADDEEIASAAALSLRFNRISGEDLPRLIAVAQDMAVVLGTDIPSATDKAAAYINLPAQALTKLKKEGYAVSDAQSKMVKDFLKANDVASAQGVIFDILEEQYGGAAEAARDTMGGALKALGTTWENFLERIGEDKLGPLREGIESLIGLIEIATDNIGKLEIGFHLTRKAVNLFTAGAIEGMADLISLTSKAAPLFGILGIAIKKTGADEAAVAKLRAGAAVARKNAAESDQALAQAILRSMGIEIPETKKLTGAKKQLTEQEIELAEQRAKLLEQAAKIVDASRDELSDIQALLQARKIGVDAMKLQQAVQQALSKAQAAGKAATSEQRLEIIRNTIAIFQSKNAIDEIGEAQKRAADLFAESNKEMLRQVTILANLEQVAIDLSRASIDININQVSEGGQLATETTRARLDYANEWRETWRSASDVAEVEIQRVMASLLTVEEKERAIAQIRSDLLDNHLNEWGSFFGTLGGMFGGVFQQISNAIGNIQQAQQAGKQLGSLIGGAGSQLSTTLGYAAATVAVIYEVYKAVDAQIEKNKRRKWGTSAQVEIVGGDWSSDSFAADRSGAEVSRSLRQLIRDILDSLDAVISDLPQISIRARKDGKEFSAYVAGVFVGTFTDAETAIQEGVRYALASGTFAAISKEMAQALKASLDATMEELQQNIATANVARRARLGDVGFGYAELNDQWLRHIEAMRKVGLAIDNAIAARDRELESYKNNVLGIDMASVERLRNLQSLSRGLAEAADVSRAAIRQQMEDIQRQIEYAQRTRGQGSGGVGQDQRSGNQSGPGGALNPILDYLEVDGTTAELQRQLQALQNELDKIPEALSEVEVDMGVFNILREYLPETAEYGAMGVRFAQMEVDKKFQELKLTLIAMGEWEQWAAVWNDAYQNAMNLAGRDGKPRGGRGGGGGRVGGRDEVRDFISDRREDLRLNGLSEHARAIAELDRQYAPMLEKAGKDIGLRNQLLALKDAEIRQLEQENIKGIVSDFQDFVSLTSSFDEVRGTATDLINRIEDSAMGDPRKANMISRILGQMNAQIDKLSKEKALSLFDSMASDLIGLGVQEKDLADARKAMQLIDHQLKMENYRTEIEILRAKGNLDTATMAIIDDAFNRLQSIDLSNLTPPVPPGPTTTGGAGYYDWITNPGVFQGYGDSVTTTIDQVGNALQEAQDLFQRYVDDGLSPFNRDLRDLNRDFAIIFEQMGQGPEVMNQYALAMERLNEQYSGDLEDLLSDLNFGANTDLSLEGQLSNVMAQFEQISGEIASGDLSNAGLYRSLGNQALELLGRVGGSGSAEYDVFRERLRNEVNLVLGNSSGPSGLLPVNTSAATEQTTSLLGDISTHSSRQITRLDTANGLLEQLLTAITRPPVTGSVRLSIGSEPTIPRIND